MILTKSNSTEININQEIQNRIASGNLDELLLVVPTNRKVRNLKKELISSSPNQTVSTITIETIGTLTSKLLEVNHNFIDLSEAAATVFIKQSCNEIDLKYFNNYKNEIPSGTLDRLNNVISEYKKHGITPELLRKEAEELTGSEKIKAIDIANIYQIFSEKCTSLFAYDTGDIYNQLQKVERKLFDANFLSVFPKVTLIIIIGFDELTDPEIGIINKISAQNNSECFIEFDYHKDNFGIFSHLNECYGKLIKSGFKIIKNLAKQNLTSFPKDIVENLFLHESKTLNYSDSIKTINANNREDEIEIIAKEIKRLIVVENVEPYSISVAFNLIQNYTHLIRDIFSVYGIPFNLTDRIPLSNSFPVTAIIHFLEILESDYYYKNILRSLNSGFIKIDDIDAANLERTASELKIVVGKYNWVKKIEDALQKLDFAKEENEWKISRYKKALSDINVIAKYLIPFEKKISLEQFQNNLLALMPKLKIDKTLLEESFGNSEINIKAVTTFIVTINEIFSLLELEHGKAKLFDLQFFLEQIRTACTWARFNVKEKSNYGVQVTTLNEIRGLNFDYLFIGGMCDGDFPTRYNPEIFFSGSYVRKENQHQAEERFRFYQSLLTFNKSLYLSYPLTDKGKDVVESSLLKEFKKVFVTSKLDKSQFDDFIFSSQDLQKKNGLKQINGKHLPENKIDLNVINEKIEIDDTRANNSAEANEYNGYLNADSNLYKETIQQLNKLDTSIYSITQLEEFAKCPFNYFLKRILRLEITEEPTEEIEAMEMGSLLHSILFEFYTTIRAKKIIMQGCDQPDFNKVVEIMFEIAEKRLEDNAFTLPQAFYEREKILGIEGNKKASILYKFLEEERKPSDSIPKYFEVSFGKLRDNETDTELRNLANIDFGGVQLRGKIDRIDVNENNNSFDVVDYKSGGIASKPKVTDLWDGISLQLPVYMHVAKTLIENQDEIAILPNNIGIYSLKYDKEIFGHQRVNLKRGKPSLEEKVKLNNELIDSTKTKIKEYVQAISNGEFGLSQLEKREEKACKYCDFGSVCRVKEVI